MVYLERGYKTWSALWIHTALNKLCGGIFMIYVGIDIAKDKHDCFIISSEGEVLFDVFTIQNNIDGFEDLLFKIKAVEKIQTK